MWRLYGQMKAENVPPNAVTYTTLITFFGESKERQMLQSADFLLRCMEESACPELKPDYRHFVPVIKGWVRIGDPNEASKVLARFIEAKGTKPSPEIIDLVMQGWLRAGDLDQATVLLAHMQELKDENILPEGPTSLTYRCLLVAWERSSHPEKAIVMEKIEERLAFLKSASIA